MNKAEIKAAAKAAFAGILAAIEDGLAGIARVEEEAAKASSVYEVRIGQALNKARDEFAAAKAAKVSLAKTAGIGTDDWREYARTNLPGVSNQTIYRWQNAGAVADVLGDTLVPGTLVTGLSSLYRGLSAAKTDEERTTAEDLVREVYAEAVEAAGTDEDGNAIPPKREDLLARAEAAFPTNRTGGGGGGTSPSDEDEDEDESDEDEADEADSTRGTSENLVTVDRAALEAAHGPTDAIVRGLVREYEVSREAVVGIMLATLRLEAEWHNEVLTLVLAGGGGTGSDEADEASESHPEDEAS